jgi:hypothetical protein
MSAVEVRDDDPWFSGALRLHVWCGDAHITVVKQTGLTEICELCEDGETCPPMFEHADDARDWADLLAWRARQTFPWVGAS